MTPHQAVPGLPTGPGASEAPSGPGALGWGPRLGVWAWSFVGVVLAVAVVLMAVAAVSEIMLPLTFAAVLAVCFRPAATWLHQHRLRWSAAAGVVVLALLALSAVVAAATIRGVLQQSAAITQSVDAATENAATGLGLDPEVLETVRESLLTAGPVLSGGFVTRLVDGLDAVIGLAGGLILGSLIMYYLLKDGPELRLALADQFGTGRDEVDGFIGESARILRDYGRGRTVMAASVAVVIGLVALLLGLPLVLTIVVVNFVGGYVPYIGAFIGGGLAVIVALGEGGLTTAAIMTVAVLAANLLLENFVEPKVMGRTLHIHPVMVILVTALGGILGGIVGLILAVPAWMVASRALDRLRRRGVIGRVAERAEPAVRRILE